MEGFGQTAYAKRDGVHLAYRLSDGDGPDVVTLMPGFLPMAVIGDVFARRFFERIAGFGRVVLLERQGVGESDPIDAAHPPSLDDVVDDVVAVMDAAQMPHAAVFGYYNAGAVSIRLAARHPDRVSKLVVMQSFVSWEPTDALQGVEAYFRERFAQAVEGGGSEEVDLFSVIAPSKANDWEFRRWWDDVGRRGASPRSALAMGTADAAWDVIDDLAAVEAPTLVVHRSGNRFVPVDHARFAAGRIRGATLVELAGDDHLGVVGDMDALLDPAEEFITSRAPHRDRVLAAVLFTDLVASTGRAVLEGDRGWTRIRAEHDQVVREVVTAHAGEVVNTTGDGVVAVFSGPTAAIRAARAMQARLAGHELQVRAGVHVGEIERLGDDITGIAVNIAARVMALAGGGEVLVSGAVPPLVVGTALRFEDTGEVELKGVPGTWTLFRVG